MEKWIKSIKGTIPHTNKTVDIELNGKNLIVTGGNGSGKTSFLREVYRKVELLIVQKRAADIQGLRINHNDLQYHLSRQTKGTTDYDTVKHSVEILENKIKEFEEGLQIEIPQNIMFSSLYDERKAIIRFFEEKRLAEIVKPTGVKGLQTEKEDAQKNDNQKLGNALEQHLVNLKTRASLAITEDKNEKLANEINNWLNTFERNLKKLFEDDSVKLSFAFEVDKTGFTILQNGKPPFTFQTLSAGYRAIFDVYAELLMRTEYFDVMPNELTGVVFIDEVDSHLHVSLQRIILPFFIESFPKIQFIVTTHSPFVLMSSSDITVYDLEKKEITEDLSYYTYSAVMKGLWNVKPISAHLENTIKEIAKIVNSEQKDYKQLEELVEATKPYENALDSESKVFLMLGVEALEEGGKNV